MKKDSESFKDVILRLTTQKGNLSRLLDAMKSGRFHSPELADRVEEAGREFRKNFRLEEI
jgi:predicted CopG family antitoxin